MEKLWIFYLKRIVLFIVAGICFVACDFEYSADYYFIKQKPFFQGSVEEQLYLDKALAIDSLHVEALVEKSVSYNKRGQFATGMYYLNKGTALDPVEHLGYRGFVKLYMFRDYEGALSDFLRLDDLTPEFRDAPWGEDIYKVIGIAYMGMNDYEKALEHINRSIDEITKDEGEDWIEPRTFMYQGVCLMEMGKVDQAVLAFDKQIQYCNECSSGYYYKAKALIEMGSDEVKDIEYLLKTANTLAQKGLIESSPYFELPFQIYPSDIDELSNVFNRKREN